MEHSHRLESKRHGRPSLNTLGRLAIPFFLSLLAIPALAAELEPDHTLEGFPFSGAASVAITADGRDLYAAGNTNYRRQATPGLVWLRRDPATGNLSFQSNYLSDTERAGVLAATLARNDLFLYVIFEKKVIHYRREADGSLSSPVVITLPDTYVPESLHTTPDGSQLIVLGYITGVGNQALFYRLDANGSPSLEQTLTASISTVSLVTMAQDLLVSGRVFLRRVGNTWAAENIPGLDAFPFASLTMVSPDRRYLYSRTATGSFPGTRYWIITFEQVSGQWVEVGRTEVDYDFEREETARAIHPVSGDIYLASIDTNGGAAARIDHFRSLEGGRIFARGVRHYDSSKEINARTIKHSLVFAGDGRHLYTTFDGEPMARLEVDPADGSLSHVPNAAGPHSHFERPFKILAHASGDTYVVTPNAILQTRWNGGQAELRSSLDFDTWRPDGPQSLFRDFVLTPGGTAGVVSNLYNLAFVERDPATGALRLLNETTIRPTGNASHLELSPDGRYLYVSSHNQINVYYLRRDVPKLVLAQEFPIQSRWLKISPDGRDVVTWDFGGTRLSYLRRDLTSGELTAATGPSRPDITDVFFTADGHLALRREHPDQTSGILELLIREGEFWKPVLQTNLPTAAAIQLFDSRTHFFFQYYAGKLEQYAATPQLGTFARLARLSGAELGSVALASSIFYVEEMPALALLPGDEDLLLANTYSGNIRLFRRGCGALAAGPCLGGGRFRAEIEWRAGNKSGPGLPLSVGSDDSQLFSFFDSNNWEVLVKVLDGCELNGRFWVYAAASTDLAYDLIITDTWTGQRSIYSNAAGVPAPAITDSNAFASCDAPSPGWNPPAPIRTSLAERPGQLRLTSGFTAKVRWKTAAGLEGDATGLETVPLQASGLFYFFDRSNWEMLVKVLDGCAINGHRWVFAAATTDVGFTLEVEENATGLRRTYNNPVGRAARATTDIQAFSCN